MTRTTLTAAMLSLCVNVPGGCAQARASPASRATDVSARRGGHLAVQNTIGDLLRHPAFAGFAPLILPQVVTAYTAHSDYASAEPPTFVVVGLWVFGALRFWKASMRGHFSTPKE